MKKYVKLLSLAAALILTTSVFSACSKKPEQTTGESIKKIAYPEKPIQVVVPAGTGGDTDANARLLGEYLAKELGQSVMVKNVNGESGTLGTKEVKTATPDGYTALFFHPSMLLNKLSGLVDYSYTDFENAGIAVMDNGNIFAVAGDSKYKTLQDVINDAKANPGTVRFATENGGFTHLQATAFQEISGAELKLVDVGGAAQKLAALKGKTIEIIGTSYGLVKSQVASGEIRVLGVLSEKRNPMMPNVPTFKEQGVDLVFDKFFFYLLPKGTPKEVVDKFSNAVSKAAANSEYQAKAKDLSVTPTYIEPSKAVEYMKNAEAVYSKYVSKMKKIEKAK